MATAQATASQARRAVKLEYFTITWNVVEAMVAIGAVIAAGSIALVGFGFDSSIEGFAASVVLWQLRDAQHEERERRALRLIAVTFFILAAYVVFESVRDLVTNSEPETSTVGIVVAIVSLIVMPTLGFAKKRLAVQMGSQVLRADAAETFLCSWLSVILLAGLVLNATVGWWWADPIAALGIAALAIREGKSMGGRRRPWRITIGWLLLPALGMQFILRASGRHFGIDRCDRARAGDDRHPGCAQQITMAFSLSDDLGKAG